MRKFIMLSFLLVCIVCEAEQPPKNTELEQRVMHLASELRCLVCQNQTLADSNAQLATDLKNELREKLAAGMTDQQAIDFMVQRYGDFVLYKPRLQPTTWLLWFGPFLILLGGLAFLLVKIRRRQTEETL
jgi:cytochrome c-type biogenesis protein CcmH